MFNKKFIIRLFLSLALSSILTIFLYWPVFEKIPLDNSQSEISSTTIKNLVSSQIKIDTKNMLSNFLQKEIGYAIPIDTHQLCLLNKNKVYLEHSDSQIIGIKFYSGDITKLNNFKDEGVGAMSIDLYYDGQQKDENYRDIMQPQQCIILDEQKLKDYASSTISYHHIGTLEFVDNLDLKGKGKLVVIRQIISGSFIDTSLSTAYISARWFYLITTLLFLWLLLYILIKKIFSKF